MSAVVSVRAQIIASLWAGLWLSACTEPRYAGADVPLEEEDAEVAREDASVGPIQSDPACVDRPSILGAECPNVVLCTDMGPCDLSGRICCLTALSADCSARTDCGVEQRARCDGPEDCHSGSICCVRDGATQCSAASDCPESQRACHTDADCEDNRCARGWPGSFGGLPVTYFADWGFCRS